MNTKNAAASKSAGDTSSPTTADHRTVLSGMFWVFNGGAPWRDMPERYGRWETVYGRFRRWTDEGLIDRTLKRLHVSLDTDGRIDWSVLDVDGSFILAHVSAAGGAESSKTSVEMSRTTSPWDDPAEALARGFILWRMVQASRLGRWTRPASVMNRFSSKGSWTPWQSSVADDPTGCRETRATAIRGLGHGRVGGASRESFRPVRTSRRSHSIARRTEAGIMSSAASDGSSTAADSQPDTTNWRAAISPSSRWP